MKKLLRMPKKGLILWMLFGMALMVSSCSKDEEKDSCTNFTTSDKELTVNGKTELLSVAQQLVSSGFEGNIYQMQIATVSSDCNELHTIELNIEIPTTSKLNGTYKIVDFFDSGLGDAYGAYANQKISPVSQTLEELSSGTLKVTDKGSKLYTFDINAKTISGSTVTLKGDVQF
ncbi:MAG: hypothetical protein KBF35_09650 [Saprospiraceae bacterium]|nr:hypothetical protein [Saprospiraceae bacterium]MBP9197919.1 hypothetical protein [Saprospiraceae bacterium]